MWLFRAIVWTEIKKTVGQEEFGEVEYEESCNDKLQVLWRNRQGPFGQILFVRDKVTAIAYLERLRRNARREDARHHTLVIDDKHIHLPTLKNAIHNLLASLKSNLEEKILMRFDPKLFPIPGSQTKVYGDINNTAFTYNFLTDERNKKWFKNSKHQLIQQVFKSEKLSNRFVECVQGCPLHSQFISHVSPAAYGENSSTRCLCRESDILFAIHPYMLGGMAILQSSNTFNADSSTTSPALNTKHSTRRERKAARYFLFLLLFSSQ
ncbi:uncharacterized protein L203_102270 [Cryptococcus depauperatus CBS 7841]|uniref:Uncharacterized protein n=1 Tax=Cryptococcus depauperatus CBS 7841 TaxID=1295531 RepID=A0AAJ8JRL3_9TREE